MAAAAGPKVSIKAIFYLNTGTFGSPTWAAVNLVGDATISPDWEKADASVRGQRLAQHVKTLLNLMFSAKIRTDDVDTSYSTIWTAANNDNILNVLILDGALTREGSRGYWIDVQVFKNAIDQALKGVQYTEFEFVPTPTANQQAYVVIGASSAITSTAIGS